MDQNNTMQNETNPKLVLILGSGFSAESGIPTTKELSKTFLEIVRRPSGGREVARAISGIILQFWRDVFGYREGYQEPSLEDHFTVIDLAANFGHHVGSYYNPKRLRAIRRMSIHRTFEILDSRWGSNGATLDLLSTLAENYDLSVVNLNWDIAVEKYLHGQLKIDFSYGIAVDDFFNRPTAIMGIPLLKVHGSANWLYCDSCRRIYASLSSKSGLLRRAYIEESDFGLFDIELPTPQENGQRDCLRCGSLLGGRVATFSYRKAFSIAQFQAIWESAFRNLTEASHWLFIGYSMPEADFEFKHLLKSAQLARQNESDWSATVILKNDLEAASRYQRFFGLPSESVIQDGMSAWVEGISMQQYIESHS